MKIFLQHREWFIMKKIPLQIKLLLNIIVFAVPIIVLTVFMYRSETVNIDFTKKEELGTRLQRPYEEVLWHIDLARQQKSTANLETKMTELKKIYAEVGPLLLFDDHNLAARKRENASFEYLSKQIEAKNWNDAISSVKTSIAHLGDISNLILDPDLDSYYVMDITLLALPQMQDRIQTILHNSDQFFTSETSQATRIQAALYASQLEESDLNRVLADAQTAINEDKNFYGTSESLQKNLPATVEALAVPTRKMIDSLRALSRGEAVSKDQYFTDANQALEQSFKTWHSSVNEMDVLLESRLKTLEAGRQSSLTYSSIALLFSILISVIIGLSIHKSIKTILASVLKLKESSESSGSISSHLNEITTSVFSRINHQAAAVEQTAAAIEEINSMLNLSADNSKEASEMARRANDSADSGQKQIKSVLNSMNDITKGSKKIVETISVIDDIAFQTNLLALNASVEAARAGEQGKGFAVVADAVRALAQKSATSAKEINELLKSNVELVNSSQQRADEAVSILDDIVSSIKNVSTLSNEIANAAQEQSVGLAQIARTMSDFEKETSDNQKNMTEVSEAAGSILEQSSLLKSIIVSLETEVRGQSK